MSNKRSRPRRGTSVTGGVSFRELPSDWRDRWRCTLVAYVKVENGLNVGDFMGVGWGKTKRGALRDAERYLNRNLRATFKAINKTKSTL